VSVTDNTSVCMLERYLGTSKGHTTGNRRRERNTNRQTHTRTLHLDEHVFREGVEVVAGVLLRVALPGAAGAYFHPVVVKAFKNNYDGVNTQLCRKKNSNVLYYM